jgi:hypothetical protein
MVTDWLARIACLLVVLGLMACRAAPSFGEPHTGLRDGALVPLATGDGVALEPASMADLVAKLAELRGLSLEAKISVEEVDEDYLRDRVTAMLASPKGRSVFVGDARAMVAFNTVAPGDRVGDAALAPLLSAELGGLFDPNTKRVYVRRRVTADQDDEVRWRSTVIHELTHAVQHEHFGALEPSGDSEDEWLANRALIEGDARLVSLLYLTGLDGFSRRRLLHMVGSRNELRTASDRQLAKLPPAVRARLSFEYWDGAEFVAALRRAGDTALLNRAFESPPTTTEQVLHPTKYLAGELPVEVALPPAPRGYRTVATGRRGELLIRVMAERCLPSAEAQVVAAGWGGDAFTLAEARDGSQGLLWSTSWDSVDDARQFVKALANRPRCWSDEGTDKARLGPLHLVRRRGRQVALARGMARPLLRSTVGRMLRRPVRRPQAQPLGDFTIPPLSPVVARRPGVIEQQTYRSGWLGVTATLPAGWSATVPDRTSSGAVPNELVVSDGTNIGWLFVHDRMATAVHNRRLVDRLRLDSQSREGLVLGGRRVGSIATVLGPGRRWIYGRRKGGGSGLTIDMIPWCKGCGSLVLVRFSQSAAGAEVLHKWAASFRPTKTGKPRPPVCTGLNPR